MANAKKHSNLTIAKYEMNLYSNYINVISIARPSTIRQVFMCTWAKVASEYRFFKYSNIGHSFSFIFEYSNIFEYRQYPTISTK